MGAHGTFGLRGVLGQAFRSESVGGLDRGWIGSERGGCWGLWQDPHSVRLMVEGRVGVGLLGEGVCLDRRRRSVLVGGSPQVALHLWGAEAGGDLCWCLLAEVVLLT